MPVNVMTISLGTRGARILTAAVKNRASCRFESWRGRYPGMLEVLLQFLIPSFLFESYLVRK